MRKVVLLGLLGLLLGCVEISDETLSIFFDGVVPPPPHSRDKGAEKTLVARQGTARRIKHDPYAEKACKDCHDIRLGQGRNLIKEVPELCFECHEGEDFQQVEEEEVLHSPVEDGECMECHHPHQADNPSLLRKPVLETCFGCHEQEDFLREEGSVHQPVQEGRCPECHDPHKSELEYLLYKPLPETCFGCHEQKDFEGGEQGVVHSPVEDGECAECHDPHASLQQGLLHRPVVQTCFGCHETEDLHEEAGDKLKNRSWNASSDTCIKCHDPHSSDQEFLIREIEEG